MKLLETAALAAMKLETKTTMDYILIFCTVIYFLIGLNSARLILWRNTGSRVKNEDDRVSIFFLIPWLVFMVLFGAAVAVLTFEDRIEQSEADGD